MDLAFDLPAEPAAPTQARIALLALTPALVPRVFEDLRLIITELVTNSVRYGPGGTIRVEITVDDEKTVRGEVRDGGEDGTVEIREAAEDGGGLGLRILDSMSHRWGVYEGSTHVWFELRTPTAD